MLAWIREMARAGGLPMSVLASAWLLGRKGVASIIAGARFPTQVFENVRAVDVTLPDKLVNELTAESEQIKAYAGMNCDQWESVSRMER